MAQKITTVMATGACSFLAPTAPAMAIAADTPHTAPPAPKVAAKGFSSPSFRATKKITKKVLMETKEAWKMAVGPAQRIREKGKVAPNSTMPILTKNSTRKPASIQRGKPIKFEINKPRAKATSGASRL